MATPKQHKAPPVDRNLWPTTFRHPATCGERIPSPHQGCQAALTPYMAAERFATRLATLILCKCGAAWREVA